MTPTMRLRLWARQAPRTQIFTTGLVLGLVLAILAVAVPQGAGGGREASVTSFDSVPGGSVGAGGSNPEAPATAPPAGTTGGGATAGGAHGSGATVPTAGSAGSAAAGGAQPAGAAPSTPRGSTPADGAPLPGATGQPEARRASDQGVTESTIKLGFTVSRPGGLDATGFALGTRPDDKEAIMAMVDYVNAAGGVKGRKIVPVIVEGDPTNRQTWQANCLRLTEDEKVFWVSNPSAYLGTGHLCYIEHGVPQTTATSVSTPASIFRDAQGLLASTGASADRVMLNWAAVMLDAGIIGRGKGKLGLLTDDCPEYVALWKQVKAFLAEAGVEFTEVKVSCDVGAAQQQVPNAVLQLRQGGVNRVFLGVIFSTAQTFMQQAQAQSWKPKYSTSDLWGNNVNVLTRNFPPDQFDRTIGTAANHSGEEPAKVPYSPGVKKCNEMITKAGLEPITDQLGRDGAVISSCDTFLLFLEIMERLPVNFTRRDWAAAVATVGKVKLPAVAADATLRQGKFEVGDSYALVEWRRECSCWVQVRRHAPGRF